jgi:hypothetical protein
LRKKSKQDLVQSIFEVKDKGASHEPFRLIQVVVKGCSKDLECSPFYGLEKLMSTIVQHCTDVQQRKTQLGRKAGGLLKPTLGILAVRL